MKRKPKNNELFYNFPTDNHLLSVLSPYHLFLLLIPNPSSFFNIFHQNFHQQHEIRHEQPFSHLTTPYTLSYSNRKNIFYKHQIIDTKERIK